MQKQTAAIGVKIGTIPKIQGNTIPIQPSNSKTPSILMGTIELSAFRCPSATWLSLLPLILP
ncbi:hypothetical protein MKS83_00735 [Chryseobacterium sp. Y16C]|nr:hypothetical protein [Chryseobacterium sp. Y16C]UMQ42225.1 hypothetical protein MKS83_00735 [Chryseobacterium sp. Y16C]